MSPTLLTRDEFRERVLARDGNRCGYCGRSGPGVMSMSDSDTAPQLDVHHIIDRSLFEDGGYYLDNGITLCSGKVHEGSANKKSVSCHRLAEQTLISTSELRQAAHITSVILPDHFEEDTTYDKWGNPVLPTGNRMIGEMFFKENVQRALSDGEVLPLFVNQVKYPRTYHTPWSPNLENDDRMHTGMDFFKGKEVVVTVKEDGENTTMYNDFIHARSVSDMAYHPSRTFVKALHGQIAHDIPVLYPPVLDNFPISWRVCGENMYAKHSIHYQNLKSYFYIFNIWNEYNVALSWNETEEWANLFGFPTVPVLYRGIYDEELIKAIDLDLTFDGDEVEGYVIRTVDPIPYHAFRFHTAKCVRRDHVRTTTHWLRENLTKNILV